MKQVVFAVLLMAMASLTGCLNGDDSPVDENIDTTDDSTSDTTEDNSDTTDDTKDDELIEPVGTNGGYTPPDKANITVSSGYNTWISKDGNRITTSCIVADQVGNDFRIYDSDDRIIYVGNDAGDYGATPCEISSPFGGIKVNITLGPEPVKVSLTKTDYPDRYQWLVTF
jgi:hypothetical protein